MAWLQVNKILVFNIMVMLVAFQLFIIPEIVSGRSKPIPAEPSKLDDWIARNMRDHDRERAAAASNHDRGNDIDSKLAEAEDNVKVVTVSKHGAGGDFRTITDAVNSIPTWSKRRYIIWIGGGVYREKIMIPASKPFVTFYGQKGSMPTITYDATASQYGTVNSATVAVESDYFVAVNIAFVNSAPMPDGKSAGEQAVAMRISGDKAAFHYCNFIGFQDTLCDDRGRHFFKNCYIQGTVDFIFGNGKSLYLRTTIHSVAEGTGVITAQARETDDDDSGFTFAYCKITGTGDTYLGRAWKERPRVVFAYTYMGTLINSHGWYDGQTEKTVYYGEYQCTGPGASSSGRVKYARMLSDEEANAFLSMTYIQGNKWVLKPPKL